MGKLRVFAQVGFSTCRGFQLAPLVQRVWFNTKGFALVIPLLPPRARERGAVELPHTHERRLFKVVGVQGFAPPVLPFVRTVERVRTSRERGP